MTSVFVDVKASMIGDFDYIDPEVQSAVLKCFVEENELLLFPYDARNFKSFPEWKQFVQDRTVVIGEKPDAVPWKSTSQTHWYKANDDHDLKQILEHEGITYWCCVVPIAADIKHDYKFVMFAYEHTEYCDEEIRALWVFEKEQGIFEKHVVPKLMNLQWFTEKRERFTCPCCGYKTLTAERDDEICAICFWHDDMVQFEDPDFEGGANQPSLRQAQRNFKMLGAKEQRVLGYVRKPTQHDERDENWRPLD